MGVWSLVVRVFCARSASVVYGYRLGELGFRGVRDDLADLAGCGGWA